MRRNLVPKAGLFALLFFFVFIRVHTGAWSAEGDPFEILGVFGVILMYVAIILTLFTTAISARRAHLAGSWPWFLGSIFIWPLSYFYALVVNRGD